MPLRADSLRDGGRDLSIELFSTRKLASITFVPLNDHAWFADCAACVHRPLTAPLQVAGAQELFAGGTLRVVDRATGGQKSATGLWHLRSRGDGIDVILTMPSERYVEAVLNAESAVAEPEQSLQALAIVTRTYALNGRHFTAAAGHLAADLCDSTQCQAMRPGRPSSAIEAAVRATAGETLWFRGRRAEVFFSQHCGGVTEDAATVWRRLGGLPYLTSHSDPYCTRNSSAAWHADITTAEMASIAASQGWRLPSPIASVRVIERSRSHRARLIAIGDSAGQTLNVEAASLRLAVGRAIGWNRLRSNQYDVALRNGVIVFDGRGYGHGVGLCQTGAAEMAADHKSAREILEFYFPGTHLGIAFDDDGWRTAHNESLTVRGATAIPESIKSAINRQWREAQNRFPPKQAPRPEITFAPSTELFRQLTSQPGWALASTAGEQIVLQPLAVFGHKNNLAQTLLHEFLHVLVENEASERAPLWLREGLVAELAGDARSEDATTAATAIDAALLHADSHSAAERAHRAAASRVHMLIGRHGMSEARGWLASGVPSGIG